MKVHFSGVSFKMVTIQPSLFIFLNIFCLINAYYKYGSPVAIQYIPELSFPEIFACLLRKDFSMLNIVVRFLLYALTLNCSIFSLLVFLALLINRDGDNIFDLGKLPFGIHAAHF